MDHHAFASLSHLRVLLLPVGSISRTTFEKWATEIRTFENMRLSDIPPGTRDEKARFMPSPKSKGYLHLSFPTHPPPTSHFAMSLFRPSHFPLGVIGIASCSHNDSLSSILADFNGAMHELFPADSLYPLARSCFVFEEGDGTTNLNLGDHLPGLVIIPSMMGNKKENIETLLADLCSNILGEFSSVLQTLESPLGNEYLNGAMFPLLPSASDMPRPLNDEPESHDSLSPLPSYNSQPELGVSVSLRPKSVAGMALKRTSSAGPSLNPSSSRQTSLMIPPTPKKRLSGIGVASSHGRLYKVLGDFFLLAGRTEDASIWYTEAIALFKLPSDIVWHASALEGLAVLSVLDAWSSGQGLQASFSNSREPWLDISERLSQAIALYSKAVPSSSSDAEQRLDILAYLYSTAVLRQTSLFFATWSAKGWGPLAFTAMLHPGPLPYIPPTLAHAEYNTPANRDRLSSISGITASHISVILAQAHGPWLLHMGHRERIIILEEIASMYSSLGYHRKEAYILREVIGCVMDLMVCGREEAGDIGLGYALANAASMMQDKGAVGVKENERPDGNESVLKLVKHVCNVHGVNLSVVKLIDTGSITSDGPLETEASQNEDPEEVVLEDPYGWPELQVGIVREALAVAEALPDSSAAAQFALSALKSLHAVLSEEDQYHFYYTSARALTTARRRGDKRVIDYWSGRPVDSIEILPLPPVKLLVENPMSILSPRQSHGVSILTGMTDPFLYNPRRAFASQQGQALVVKNEILELRLTLRNPYVFNLEIEALALSTSGVPFESKPISVVIPANSFHSITMSGKPLDAGILTIRGCFVQAPGGASHEFVLPLSTVEEEDKKSRRRSTIACESGRSKYHGLDSRPWEKAGKRLSIQAKGNKASTELRRFLDCKVVPEQPLLRIRWSSLTHGAVMLYDGETSTIRLTLENVSSLPIDFLRLTFDDSTIPSAQQALVDGELSVFDTYETEYELISRPVFSWTSDLQQTKIPPHRKVTIVITCLGKVGCTSGAIHVAYGYVHRKQDLLQKPSDVFHTRRLSYPVLVTVYHMLECYRMDILPFRPQALSNSNDEQGDNNSDTARKNLLRVDEDSWCLFSIDVRNTYGLPFEVTFDRIQEGSPHASTTCLVAPGSTSRIVLPLKKFLLPNDIASQPIPTLSDRQFVVAKSNLTSGEEVAQRELFWYREELFKCVRGRWREAGGTRSGELSLRQQRMSLPMLENLRTESARVSMCLVCCDNGLDDSWQTVDQKDGKFLPKPYDFVYLQIKVTNLSLSPLVLTADVLADPSDHVIQEGVLLDIPLGHLDSGESREIETTLCFVSCGRFELTAEIRVMGLSRDEGKVGTGLLTAIVRDE